MLGTQLGRIIPPLYDGKASGMASKHDPSSKATLFASTPFTFGDRFLADHAGQIISEPRVAIVELVANAYDAGATKVKITWPEKLGDYFEIADNGTGMTPEEFTRRWKHFNYSRRDEQGEDVTFPKGTKGK